MATQKVKLGNVPKNFKKPVEIVTLDGSVAAIEISYIYRTRSQFAALVDEGIADGVAKSVTDPAEPVAERTTADWYRRVDEGGVDLVLKVADGWDLDNPFNEKSLLQLEDENPGSLQAIATIYRQAVAEARVKN